MKTPLFIARKHRDMTHYVFASTEIRDRLLDKMFPERRCVETPGTHALPDGSTLHVYQQQVWHYEKGEPHERA